MKFDTREILDIAYTTDSLFVTTPIDGHTSEVIAKQEKELLCLEPHVTLDDYLLLITIEVAITR